MAPAQPLVLPTEVVDYRRTFLRRHIARELEEDREVLAVVELRQRFSERWRGWFEKQTGRRPLPAETDAFRRALRKYLTPRQFFFGESGIKGLYCPVEVQELGNPLDYYEDLSQLLATVRTDGIVLQSHLGSGKTVAQRKAFWDCLHPSAASRLAGYLPCWLRFNDQMPERLQIEQALWQAAWNELLPDQSADQLRQLREWLRYGPNLLLFCDLNAVRAGAARARVTAALREFQQAYRGRHRLVVAYRSFAEGEALWSGEGTFRRFKLMPLVPEQGIDYLHNFRRLEVHVTEQLRLHEHIDLPPFPDETAICLEGDAAGLLSTPLLLHYVSLLGDGAKWRNEAQLYNALVENALLREWQSRAHLLPLALQEDHNRALPRAGMTRLALYLLDRSPSNPALQEPLAREVLESPQNLTSARTWPRDPFWHEEQPPYYYNERLLPANGLREEVVRALLECSLLQRDPGGGRQLRFLHDSLVYYFAGVLALRYYRRPDTPALLCEAWYRKVAERVADAWELWELPGKYLGNVLDHDQLRRLVLEFLPGAPPHEGVLRVLQQILEGHQPEQPGQVSFVLKLREALVWFGERSRQEKGRSDLLLQTVLEHLSGTEDPSCNDFASELESRLAGLRK